MSEDYESRMMITPTAVEMWWRKYENLKAKVLQTIEDVEEFLGQDPYVVYIDTIEDGLLARVAELKELVK